MRKIEDAVTCNIPANSNPNNDNPASRRIVKIFGSTILLVKKMAAIAEKKYIKYVAKKDFRGDATFKGTNNP